MTLGRREETLSFYLLILYRMLKTETFGQSFQFIMVGFVIKLEHTSDWEVERNTVHWGRRVAQC